MIIVIHDRIFQLIPRSLFTLSQVIPVYRTAIDAFMCSICSMDALRTRHYWDGSTKLPNVPRGDSQIHISDQLKYNCATLFSNVNLHLSHVLTELHESTALSVLGAVIDAIHELQNVYCLAGNVCVLSWNLPVS